MSELPRGVAGGGTGAIGRIGARDNRGIPKQSVAPSLGGVAGFAGYRTSYRIPLTAGAGGSSGFQMQILVGESSGSVGASFDVDGQSTDFPSGENVGGDFVFTKAGGALIPFYVERVTSSTPNRVATIWLALPNGSAADTIFLLTNHALTVANQSDPDAVFTKFYDSFAGSVIDTSKWTVMNSTGLTVGSGSMRHTNNSARVRSNAVFSTNDVLEVLWNGVSRNSGGHTIAGFGNVAALGSNSIGYFGIQAPIMFVTTALGLLKVYNCLRTLRLLRQ